MGNERQLQCKALRRREKSRRRGNNEEQWKEQCAEQWKQSEIRARADVSAGHIDTPKKKPPAAERRRAHTFKTRISAIAHPSAERTLKSAPALPASYQRPCKYSLIRDGPARMGGGAPRVQADTPLFDRSSRWRPARSRCTFRRARNRAR